MASPTAQRPGGRSGEGPDGPSPRRPPPLWRSFLRVGLVMAAFVLLFGLTGWLTLQWVVGGEEVEVPGLVGRPLAEAESAVEAVGLRLEVEPRRLSDPEVPANAVLRQFPGPGTALNARRTVRVILSSGPPHVAAVSKVGDFVSEARIRLQQAGQQIDYVAYVHALDVEADRVVAQEPDPAELSAGTTRPQRLLVSLGPRAPVYVMPDLLGLGREQVEAFLQRNGFRIGNVTRRSSPTLPPGTVVNQVPSQGFRVPHGAVVHLEVTQ